MENSLEMFLPELRLRVYKNLLPAEPINLDTERGLFWSCSEFSDKTLQLVAFPDERIKEEYLYEYYKHTTFVVKKHHSMRNIPLEHGLLLIGEANINRIRKLVIELAGCIDVKLAFEGSTG